MQLNILSNIDLEMIHEASVLQDLVFVGLKLTFKQKCFCHTIYICIFFVNLL